MQSTLVKLTDSDVGSSFADCTSAGEQHFIVQSRQPFAVLHAHDATDDRGPISTFPDAPRVSTCLLSEASITLHDHVPG